MTFAFYFLLAFGLIGICYWLLTGNKKKKDLDTHFQDFLVAWAAWHASGAGKHKIFARNRGLCDTWNEWSRPWRWEAPKGSKERTNRIWEANRMLVDRFKAEGRCAAYPFNDGFASRFKHEEYHGLIHTNKDRILFVKRHIK